jgi:hypothetical protein
MPLTRVRPQLAQGVVSLVQTKPRVQWFVPESIQQKMSAICAAPRSGWGLRRVGDRLRDLGERRGIHVNAVVGRDYVPAEGRDEDGGDVGLARCHNRGARDESDPCLRGYCKGGCRRMGVVGVAIIALQRPH